MKTRRTHNLKTMPSFFHDVSLGYKNFEIRKNDRDFRPGDRLNLVKWPVGDDAALFEDVAKVGPRVLAAVKGVWDLTPIGIPGYVAMSLEILETTT